jgi:hypothetical protein
MFPATIKPWTVTGDSPIYPTEFQVINGTVEIVNSALISFTPWNANADVDVKDKAFNFIFENVKFDVVGTANSIFTKFGIDSSTPNATAYPNITLNNCTVDISKSVNNVVIFDLGNGLTHATVTVNGGEILAGNNSFTLYTKNENTETDISFGNETGAYTVITVPSGVILPVIKVNGGALAFSKTSDDGTTATYTLMSATLVDFKFRPKSSITLGSELVYNVYVPVTAALQSFTVNGITYENLEIIPLEDGDYYLIRVVLPASEAAKNIVLKAVVTIDGTNYNGTWTMSIPKYASKIINDGNEAEVQLVKDVLSYIRAAYSYFDKTDAEAMAKIDALLGDDYDAKNSPVFDGSADAPTEGLKAATFVLNATPAIRFYITDTNANYEFFVNGIKLAVKEGSDENGAYLEMDVYAYAMCETIVYKINGVESGSYHINSYYTFVTTDEEYKDDSNLINLVERFAKYCESAKAYRNYVLSQNSEN